MWRIGEITDSRNYTVGDVFETIDQFIALTFTGEVKVKCIDDNCFLIIDEGTEYLATRLVGGHQSW